MVKSGHMKYVVLITVFTAIAFVIGFIANDYVNTKPTEILKLTQPTPEPTPLSQYTIDNLSNENIESGTIKVIEILEEEDNYTSSLISFTFKPAPTEDDLKQTTGMLNVPNEEGEYPIVVMFRGYVDQSIYTTGIGTKNAASYFADNGFITIAPDFLGYAGSDHEADNIFETRFQTYTAALSLLKSLDQIDKWDGKNIFIWGHSNGGQIALTVLEITKDTTPTTLWAPVTKPFPYSILYYTDESSDKGKYIRSELAEFERLYDVEYYSLDNYVNYIKAPLQIHQGTNDDAIPIEWTNSFVDSLEESDIEVEYYTYPGADHNLRPNWNEVVAKDIEFFTLFIR